MIARKKVNLDWTKREQKSSSFFTRPSVYHALIIIFLEFFAFGLITAPMITVLDETFPKHTLLMNGLIQGVKGFLSFLSAPLLGALSDVFGRKPFLLLTVTFTCSPIPLMNLSHWWYFTLMTFSGMFAVTFSVVFAYVADITSDEDRSWTYGLVSATFAASLVTSPAIGAYLGKVYSDNFVIALATAVALLDIFFILACVPESLPEKCRPGSWGTRISWEKADPFRSLKRLTSDHLILMLCITTFLSYLPEAGEYSCFFVYLRLVMSFTEESVALFIAVVGLVSCLSQTLLLHVLINHFGPKRAIIVGLTFEMIQLTCYGVGSQPWLLWFAGIVAGLGSMTYPALSAFVSNHAEKDQQGVTQGVLTGIRGLCNGLGPAVYGFIFYVFQVDLTSDRKQAIVTNLPKKSLNVSLSIIHQLHDLHEHILPGPPFAFGAILVVLAILVTFLIPDNPKSSFSVTRGPRLMHNNDDNNKSPSSSSSSSHTVGFYRPLSRNSINNHHHTTACPTTNATNNTIPSTTSTSSALLSPASAASSSSSQTIKTDLSTPNLMESNAAKRLSSSSQSYMHSTSAAAKRFLYFWMRWRKESRSIVKKPNIHLKVDNDHHHGGGSGGHSSNQYFSSAIGSGSGSVGVGVASRNTVASSSLSSVMQPLLLDSDSGESHDDELSHQANKYEKELRHHVMPTFSLSDVLPSTNSASSHSHLPPPLRHGDVYTAENKTQ